MDDRTQAAILEAVRLRDELRRLLSESRRLRHECEQARGYFLHARMAKLRLEPDRNEERTEENPAEPASRPRKQVGQRGQATPSRRRVES